jgi:DNA helicase-2/ATP-dependent DNA helicase PcrA
MGVLKTIIDSDTTIANFETHIKVSAGPGAGKTTWLINHIKTVLNNSERLKVTRKIACITYTNAAVETITKRLAYATHQVEVTTIHSFLYTHVLKPYIHFIASEYEVGVLLIKGHDDKILTGYQFLKDWKARTGQARIRDDNAVAIAFSKLRWTFNSSGQLDPTTSYPMKADGYFIKTKSYMDYKKMAWSKGVIHHDDVLFLSYQLLLKFPFILDILRAKFPYFFIDEFQDINPIQLKILHLIIQKETVACVIGDNAQSIYGFMGATPNQFKDFSVLGMDSYVINDNRRSTDSIINLLNKIRPDLIQKGIRAVPGKPPVILIGDKLAALQKVKDETGSNDICTLTRDNLLTNSIRKGVTKSVGSDLIDELYKTDKDSNRKRTIIRCIKAIEYAKQGYFKDAMKETSKMADFKDEVKNRKKGLETLKHLLDNQDRFINGSLIDLYNFVNDATLATMAKLATGKPTRTFYEINSYLDLSLAVKTLNEALPFRTIHKSKGDEFDTVLLVLPSDDHGVFNESEELSFILKPNLDDEEQRIKYVAVSRAMNNLYINAPTLSTASTATLRAIGIEIP